MKFFKHHKTFILLLVIFLAALVLRVMFLDRVLPGITNDEMKFIFNAKAVWFSGTSAYGGWNMFSLNGDPHEFYDNETTPAILAPLIGPLPYTLYFVRIPYALLSVMDILFILVIAWYLFGKRIGVIAAFMASVNPYLILVGRQGNDPTIAMFFLLFGVTLLFLLKGWKVLLAFIPFFFGFYGYSAVKVSFLPFILVVLVWFSFCRKDMIKQYAVLFFLCIFLVISFVYRLPTLSVHTRSSELLLPNSPSVRQEVNTQRTQMTDSPGSSLFINKYGVWFFNVIKNYADAFNVKTLFVTGEVSGQTSFWRYGYFYLIDFCLLLFGLVMMYKKYPKNLLLLLSIIAVVPLAGAMHNDTGGSFVGRAAIMYPLLGIIIAGGAYYLLTYLWEKNRTILAIICCVYALSISSFLYLYFLQMPIYNAEGSLFSRRLVSHYAYLSQKAGGRVYVFATDPANLLRAYLLYTAMYNSLHQVNIVKNVLHSGEKTGVYQFENVIFSSTPKKVGEIGSEDTIIFQNTIIPQKVSSVENPLIVSNVATGGDVYKIYQGKVCAHDTLRRYPSKIPFTSLSVESLPEKVFCETFITKY